MLVCNIFNKTEAAAGGRGRGGLVFYCNTLKKALL